MTTLFLQAQHDHIVIEPQNVGMLEPPYLPRRYSRNSQRGAMDRKQLENFRERLETRRQELRQSVTAKQQSGRTVEDTVAPDVIDRAASTYTKDFLFRQSTNERHLLEMVEECA